MSWETGQDIVVVVVVMVVVVVVVVNVIYIPLISQETPIRQRGRNGFTFCSTRLSRTNAGLTDHKCNSPL